MGTSMFPFLTIIHIVWHIQTHFLALLSWLFWPQLWPLSVPSPQGLSESAHTCVHQQNPHNHLTQHQQRIIQGGSKYCLVERRLTMAVTFFFWHMVIITALLNLHNTPSVLSEITHTQTHHHSADTPPVTCVKRCQSESSSQRQMESSKLSIMFLLPVEELKDWRDRSLWWGWDLRYVL